MTNIATHTHFFKASAKNIWGIIIAETIDTHIDLLNNFTCFFSMAFATPFKIRPLLNCSKGGGGERRVTVGSRGRSLRGEGGGGWFFPFSSFFDVKLGENRVIGTNGRVSFSHGRIFHIFPNKYYK